MVEDNKKLDIQRSTQLSELTTKLEEIGKTKVELTDADFDKLQGILSNLVHAGQDILIEQNILKSLRFREIKVRIENISEAHAKTFEWLLQHHGPEQSERFMEWLEDTSENLPPYWVGGKAGSGKSTLMKFICDHERTMEALRIWAGSAPLVTSRFFFWSYGTEMQKSQQGLLQTLLYDILRKCPNLIQQCLPQRWIIGTQDTWTRSELLEAFSILNHGLVTSTKFCLFIDGLDEFDGDPRELLPVIKNLADSPNIKICVSSRPWQIFKDAFDQNTHQRLYLQELTKGDIEAYVRSNFESDANFLQAKEDDAGYEELVNEVVERAQGVFLWVSLVTKSLLNGFTYGDSLRTLQMRLEHLPVDLEDFFQHMLNSVEAVYQKQMAETFLIALAANEALPLLIYSFLDDVAESSRFALDLATEQSQTSSSLITFGNMSKRELRMQKRLDARTKGLLEASGKGLLNRSFRRVDFLHRSVGDFLNRKDIKARFLESAGPNYNPRVSLCHGYLAQIKFVDITKVNGGPAPDIASSLRMLIHELLDYAYVSETETATAQIDVIDELERYLCSKHPWRSGIGLKQKQQSLKLVAGFLKESHTILELTVQHRLAKYLSHRLDRDPSLVSSKQWHRPLLSHAFFPSKSATRWRTVYPTSIVNVLLEYGADPNAADGNTTTWREFILAMIETPSKSKMETMNLLLANGADPCGGGSGLLEILTIVSTSPAKSYQMAMFDKLMDAGANPNSKFDDSTVWKRFLTHLIHGKSGLQNRNILKDEFKHVKRLLLAGADYSVVVEDQSVDAILQATFKPSHTIELMETISKRRAESSGGFLSRVWRWS
jgi:hypothetical protein